MGLFYKKLCTVKKGVFCIDCAKNLECKAKYFCRSAVKVRKSEFEVARKIFRNQRYFAEQLENITNLIKEKGLGTER